MQLWTRGSIEASAVGSSGGCAGSNPTRDIILAERHYVIVEVNRHEPGFPTTAAPPISIQSPLQKLHGPISHCSPKVGAGGRGAKKKYSNWPFAPHSCTCSVPGARNVRQNINLRSSTSSPFTRGNTQARLEQVADCSLDCAALSRAASVLSIRDWASIPHTLLRQALRRQLLEELLELLVHRGTFLLLVPLPFFAPFMNTS